MESVFIPEGISAGGKVISLPSWTLRDSRFGTHLTGEFHRGDIVMECGSLDGNCILHYKQNPALIKATAMASQEPCKNNLQK